MINYPVLFQAAAKATSGISSLWQFESQGLLNGCAIPPEFEGPGGAYSPEDLFAQALTNCFVATFKVYAEKSKLVFQNVDVQTELSVDLDETKKPIMSQCRLKVSISGCGDVQRAKLIANKAFASGFILNSVKTEVKLDLHCSE